MLKSVDFELHVQEPYFSQLKGIILFFSFIYMFFNLLLCSFAYFQGFDNCRKLLSFVGGCKTVEGRCASSNNNRYDIIWLVFDWGGECGHCKMCILFLYGKWENRSLRILRIEVTGYHIHLVKWLNLTNFYELKLLATIILILYQKGRSWILLHVFVDYCSHVVFYGEICVWHTYEEVY